MIQLALQPNLYSTGGPASLGEVLRELWGNPGQRPFPQELVAVSAFGTHNASLLFTARLKELTANGTRIRFFFAGSKSTNTVSVQLVKHLVSIGVEVHVLLRPRLVHAKAYGVLARDGRETVCFSSGNFTGAGLNTNVETLVTLRGAEIETAGFDWPTYLDALVSAAPAVFTPHEATTDDDPGWEWLYDEHAPRVPRLEPEATTLDVMGGLVLTLGHADTARVLAAPGTDAAKGTQYFWLPKDSMDFFPALEAASTAPSGKTTYSTTFKLEFHDMAVVRDVRATFEAENNQDFRLGTGPLKTTQLAKPGDVALLVKRDEGSYGLWVLPSESEEATLVAPALEFEAGHQGKRWGLLDPLLLADVLTRVNGRTSRL